MVFNLSCKIMTKVGDLGAICRCNYGQTAVAQLYLDLSDSYFPIFYRKELHHVKKRRKYLQT